MSKKSPNKAQRRATRLRKAQAWAQSYDGQQIARAYRKKFGVDHVCAIKDLEEIGAIAPEEAERLREAETIRREQLKQKQEQAPQAKKSGRAGKNHEWVNGRLLQTNKKWSHLKASQKSWIQQITAEEHAAYIATHGWLPRKRGKEAVLDAVHARVNERGIWIPYSEFAVNVGKMIDRLNRKSEKMQTKGESE